VGFRTIKDAYCTTARTTNYHCDRNVTVHPPARKI
jgi:hypothetical protein